MLTSVKIVGGAAVLWVLGAPAWAIAGWLLMHLTFKLRRETPCEHSCEQADDLSWRMLSSQAAWDAVIEPGKPANNEGSR